MLQQQIRFAVAIQIVNAETGDTAWRNVLPERRGGKTQTVVYAFGCQRAFRCQIQRIKATIAVKVSLKIDGAGNATHTAGRKTFLQQKIRSAVEQALTGAAVIKHGGTHNACVTHRTDDGDCVITDAELWLSAQNWYHFQLQVIT